MSETLPLVYGPIPSRELGLIFKHLLAYTVNDCADRVRSARVGEPLHTGHVFFYTIASVIDVPDRCDTIEFDERRALEPESVGKSHAVHTDLL